MGCGRGTIAKVAPGRSMNRPGQSSHQDHLHEIPQDIGTSLPSSKTHQAPSPPSVPAGGPTMNIAAALSLALLPMAATAGDYASCLLDRMPGSANNAITTAVIRSCMKENPGGFYDIEAGDGRGIFGYRDPEECTLKKAKDTREQRAAMVIASACRCLYREPAFKGEMCDSRPVSITYAAPAPAPAPEPVVQPPFVAPAARPAPPSLRFSAFISRQTIEAIHARTQENGPGPEARRAGCCRSQFHN